MKKALIVDDSALVRRYLSKVLEDLGLEVEVAKDGNEALEKALTNSYDLITLDIEMPGKNGLEVLKEIMRKKPTRVLVISSYTNDGSEVALQALDLGALDTLAKDSAHLVGAKEEFKRELKKKIDDILAIPKYALVRRSAIKKVPIKKPKNFQPRKNKGYVLIGASTGGPGLIETIAKSIPSNYPHGICVVQHMPQNFTQKFAMRLNQVSTIEVLEAENGMEVKEGRMIIGKGGKHLHFRKEEEKVVVKLIPNVTKRFFVPSVDEMFLSALEVMDPKKILAVLLTGIGDDGAEGMVALKRAGAYTIAESEETAVVYGMPKEAFVRGGTCEVLPFPKIVERILEYGEKNGV